MSISRVLVFLIAVIVGVEVASFVRDETVSLNEEMAVSRDHKSEPAGAKFGPSHQGQGTGTSGPHDFGSGGNFTYVPTVNPDALQILSKPKALYTEEARENNIQGSVRLKIILLASGAVGSITPVTRLPYGLTEQAISAARQIRFKPKHVNGQPVSVVVTFEYGFNIY